MRHLLPLAPLFLTLAVPAQQTKILPVVGNVRDGNSWTYFPFLYDAFRFQQVWDGSAVATNNASITATAFRRDTADNTAHQGQTTGNFTLRLSHTTATPATLSTTFAANVTSPQTIAFQGSLNLPNQPSVIGSATFNIVIPHNAPYQFQTALGNLLAEYEIPGNASRKSIYNLDADYAGRDGIVTSIGTAGTFAGGSMARMTYDASTTQLSQVVPGGSIGLRVASLPVQAPTFIAFGLSSLFWAGGPLPFDVGTLGATGNTLYTSLDALTPALTPQPAGNQFQVDLTAPIPNVANLAGRGFFNQAITLHQPSNGLGAVFTNALHTLIGGMTTTSVTNMMGDASSTQATGGFAFNGTGGPVVQFTGTFN
jgi:hypothetical protein